MIFPFLEFVNLIAAFWEAVMRCDFVRGWPRAGDSQTNKPLRPGFGRLSGFLLMLLLSAATAAFGPSVRASEVANGATVVERQPSSAARPPEQGHHTPQDEMPGPRARSTASDFCEALAAAATANDLPLDFFTRLLWRESHFKPDAISPKGAQGIAQFMPETARSSGLEDPFSPGEAIAKSGELLRDLRREFGNLGLAAAAYNAGSGRVHDWLAAGRALPQQTRAYVLFVTGRSVEEWTGSQTDLALMHSIEVMRCDLHAIALTGPKPHGSEPKPETVKPWGVEVVGAPTSAKALARYREWQSKYAAIIANREPQVVIRGIIGQMGAARVRVGEDTQVAAKKLCAALKAVGAYCDVLRN
ncbi:MAG: lytic transglycosylase domain-containing protein [Alphaproteobacteria bacterium]|nr:lytic transglycosylase domain-containing protein [Alphaproteobacteria bacterium]